MKATKLLLALGAVLAGACELDIANPNSPEAIGPNPSPAQVAAAATGLLIGSRGYYDDMVLDLGIVGREAYRFDGSDPRFISELLVGPLDAGSGAFGGDHWFEPYRNIRSAHNLLNAIGTATALSAAQQNAIRGFVQTIQALDFLTVVNTHTQDSIPIDINRALSAGPAPFVSNAAALSYIVALLDSAQTALQAGGGAFPFDPGSGFVGFTTPATFLRFNRALMARVEVYRGSLGGGAPRYTAALTALVASFIDTTASMSLGVYHAYGTGPGDDNNFLSQDPQTSDNVVHPSVRDSVLLKANAQPDDRYTAKVVARPLKTAPGTTLSSDRSWINYPSPGSSIAIIRNEELILLRAEANLGLGANAAFATDINTIRVKSGGLAARTDLLTITAAARLGELLVQRKYSLLYEGGHRWIDMRRNGRLSQIPLDRAGDVVHPRFPVPEDEVLARQ